MRSVAAMALGTALLTGCASQSFDFDQVSTEGFSVEGIYDGATQRRVSHCTNAQLNELLALVPEAEDVTDAYALSLRPKAECFPAETNTGFWRLDFVSPDLSGDEGWQNLKKFQFAMQTNVPGIVVQPLVRVRKPNGREVFYIQTDTVGAPTFVGMEQQDAWQSIDFQLPQPSGEDVTIIEVQIRVFGPTDTPLSGEGQSFVMLDSIQAFRG